MDVKFRDVIRLDRMPSGRRCRVFYVPLQMELGVGHYENHVWHAYAPD